MKIKKIIISFLLIFACLSITFFAVVWMTTYHPGDMENETVDCADGTPLLQPGQKLKVLSWNIQYMAGKNYVFWYDLLDGSGPDTMPSSSDITATLVRVARVIKDENPDIVLLQEVDDGAKRTGYMDQLKKLFDLLPPAYCCNASAFYWKASFVPHPKIMGSVGMKLVTISKYKMSLAKRHQLPLIPKDPISRQFNLKRAILETRLLQSDGRSFVVLNTHLDAFAQGTDTMQKQVKSVISLLKNLSRQGFKWIIGGDFNLLPPGEAYAMLDKSEKAYYSPKTQIADLFNLYRSIPDKKEVNGPNRKKWFTHFPNRRKITKPDRTIDYIFISDNIKLKKHYIRQHDTLKISDHLPVIATIKMSDSNRSN